MTEKKPPRVGVGVMLHRDGKLLLGQRHHDPAKAGSELHGEGTWSMPGGGVEFHEALRSTVRREVEEETGLRIREEDLALVSVVEDMVHDAHFITLGFLCTEIEGEPRVMEPDEITRWDWFPLDRLPSPLFSASAAILERYRAGTVFPGANERG
jgi:8-oxo-dGTP diphosphatase